jgi:hypothetical protein
MNKIPAPSALADRIVHVDRFRTEPQAARPSATATVVRVSSVQSQPIRWLWQGRIARGKVTLVAGNPGLGKSQFTAYLAARVTTGQLWPAGEGRAPKGNVIMLSAEDDIADTIRPRLEAADADIDRVHVLTAIRDADALRSFSLGRDLVSLDSALQQVGDVKLIIVDPISAYMAGTDSHKNSDVRALLAPVSDLASRQGAAIVVISHLNKGGGAGDAMGRITGSIAFSAAARAAFLIQKDAEDSKRRLFLPMKNNLGVDDSGLAFRIVEREVSGNIRAPVIEWEDQRVTITADEALAAASANDSEEGGALREAVSFLENMLAAGPASQRTVKSDANANGISEASLRRAKVRLSVKARKDGMSGGWLWELPAAEDAQGASSLSAFEDAQGLSTLSAFEDVHENPKMLSPKTLSTFGNFEHLRAECRPPPVEPEAAVEAPPNPETEAIEIAAPEPYARRVSELQRVCPDGVPWDRWRLCLEDARAFFPRWGRHAQKFGWSSQDLLGLHAEAPLARHDQMGLLWALQGQSVADLGGKAANLSGGLIFRRRG